MRPIERQTAIADVVLQRNRVSVDSLAAMFSTSPETIRRDLAVLARNGKIQKVHGGAVLPRMAEEGPFADRMRRNVAQKRRIAASAFPLISSGETLFINTGSTTLLFADELVRRDALTVITNSAELARVLSSGNPTCRVYLIGGAYDGDNRETCGPIAIEQLGRFRADRAVLTVGAVETTTGVMDYNPDEAEMARAMIRFAGSVTVLADSSKFGQLAPFAVAGFDSIDCMVCDEAPDGQLATLMARERVEIIC